MRFCHYGNNAATASAEVQGPLEAVIMQLCSRQMLMECRLMQPMPDDDSALSLPPRQRGPRNQAF